MVLLTIHLAIQHLCTDKTRTRRNLSRLGFSIPAEVGNRKLSV